MPQRWIQLGLPVLAMLMLSGCALTPVSSSGQVETQRQALNQGYAQLFWTADKLQHINKLLLIKLESDPVESIIDALADTMAGDADDLEHFADTVPAFSLDDDGLPEYEWAKRRSVFASRGLDVGLPLVGRSGEDFERTLLLSLSAALNQQRHLVRVMRDDEPVAAVRQWLAETETSLDALYQRFEDLLQARYFCSVPEAG
ncbi:MAG: hypothetical protein VX549_12705 [Pseudomonadota bacterium]|nr:hypothetical protein [Pseudomonadota bacterium]